MTLPSESISERQRFFTKRAFAVGFALLAIALLVGFAFEVSWATKTQNGWRCFETAHDPDREQRLFIDCIVTKTRWDMARNPHLYGELTVDPTRVPFEFLGVTKNEGGERWTSYYFRYPTAHGPYCRYYLPDGFGRYYVQGAYPETDRPNGICKPDH